MADAARIVVGFDGSDEAVEALRTDVTLAEGRAPSVEVITSWRRPIKWCSRPVSSAWSALHDAAAIRARALELALVHRP
jgi:hypothetical protein